MNYRIKHSIKNEKGLTLVELLAVVVILGIISAIAVPSVGKLIENTQRDAAVANAIQVINSAKLAVAAGMQKDGIKNAKNIEDYISPFTNPFKKEAIPLENVSINWDDNEPTVNMGDFGCKTVATSGRTYLVQLTSKDARMACPKP